MKRFFPLMMTMLAAYTTSAQKPAVKTPGSGGVPVVKFNSKQDSIQYTLGAFVGLFVLNNHFPLTGASPVFVRGLEDILQNRARPFPDSLIGTNLTRYQESIQGEKGMQDEQRLFAMLKEKAGVGMFPSGVRYIVLTPGKGARAAAETDSITLNLQARLPDGTVVEDTYQSKAFEATPASFFPGLTEVLMTMNEGSKWQVFVPAALAYGDKGTRTIPPHSALVIELELVRVRKK